MGIFEQKNDQYGSSDLVGILRDTKLVTGAFSATKSVRSQYESHIVNILNQKPLKSAELRNDMFKVKDGTVSGHVPNTSLLKGADITNLEYHRLLAIREMLIQNPEKTLTDLHNAIEGVFLSHGVNATNIQDIAEMVKNVEQESFEIELQKIEQAMGHVGLIYFLEGCITAGKCLDQIKKFAQSKKTELNKVRETSFEYWNFHNVERLAETRQKLGSLETGKNSKAFILSGGAGNTLAGLGVLRSHLESGGSISAISGTSMGGALAAIVGSIGNDINKITELMHDLENGFDSDGKHYSITELNLYIPGVPILAKAFIERIMKKYGVEKNTRFSDLKIPVVINAGRQYKNGEQEIMLGGGDLVHDSILASMNVPIPGLSNFGGLGRTKIDGVAMIDYAANERGNPTHWIESLGIIEEDMIVVDSGYSSEAWTESYGTATRRNFMRATQRDFFAKLRIFREGGLVININPELAGEGGGGKINPKRTRKLYELGSEAYPKNSTYPLSR